METNTETNTTVNNITNIVSGVVGLFKVINTTTNTLIKDNDKEIKDIIKKCEIDIVNDNKIVENTGESLKDHLKYKYTQREIKLENRQMERKNLENRLNESNLTKEEIIEIKDNLTNIEKKINMDKLKQTFNGLINNIAEKYDYDIKFNQEIVSKELEKYKKTHLSILKNQFIEYIDNNS
jgi:hypothetical protein